ncbi:MAG: ABC transporter permease, partial [Synergistales bacterium]|nr:ABC transporter permease [Synergistales bacterium]
MNFEYYVAKRLIKHKDKNFTRPIIRIAQITIMLSVAVMLISVSVLQGFKKEIKSKIAGFSSHIQITQYSTNAVLEDNSLMSLSSLEKQQILNNKNVKTLYPVFSRGGVLINKEDFQGVICKGVDSSYDKTFFTDNIVEGKFPSLNKESKQEILVSKTIKDKLKIKLNDKIKIYFYVNNSYRAKNFYVSGVYDTGLGEYDENFLVCDMSVLKNIFSVEDDMFSCYEVMLKDFSSLRKASQEIYYTIGQDKSIMPITDLEPNLFSWLNLLDSNVVMIILVMILVSVVTLSSIMLIMIFEKKKMIGVLKSFG